SHPWRVERVEMRFEEGAVHIYLEHAEEASWVCPECGRESPLYDHQPEREWRHLDTCQYRTILHAAPPRSSCPEHGVKVVALPWAEISSRFTALFEGLAIAWLRAASQKAVAGQLGLTWDEIHGIMDRAVRRGLARRKAEPLKYLGVDEKAFRKGHRYFTLVTDLEKPRVLYVAEERQQASLDGFWPTLTEPQREGIAAVAMDMWEPYVASVRQHLSEAEGKIVFDKFHIAGHLGQAVDKVRRGENQQLRKQGDDRLVGSKYDWLRHPGNFTWQAWQQFGELRESALKTARAWALKETAMHLFDYRYEGSARSFFRRWYGWACRSRLQPFREVARMLKSRLDQVLTYLKHHITNAASESMNAKIQWVKYTARGFRNPRNFKTAIYFHCGGLDLAP
ncbi:MAG: ISL3 family transposase, partial [Terriglobales bacterium]